jgi:hypothetical protein
MHEPEFLRFASDATWLGLWAAGLLVFAAFGMVADRRRIRRKHIDAVGWLPWTTLSFLALFGGVVLLSFALKGWLAG